MRSPAAIVRGMARPELARACCDWLRDHYGGHCEPGVEASAMRDGGATWHLQGCDGETEGVRYCPGCGAMLPTVLVSEGVP